MNKSKAILGLASIGIASLLQAKNSQPNILFIMVDDMGYGDVAKTGHPFISTPNIDSIANDGINFKNFYAAASVCSPSRASLMTGKMSYRLGVYSFIYNGGGYVHLKGDEVTFPQKLRASGYDTALIGKWHASHHDTREKFNQPTMEEYGYNYYYSSDNNTIIKDKPGWWFNGKHIGKQKGFAANVVGRETLNWLDKKYDPKKPFLLSMHFYEPHWLIEAPTELVEKYKPHIKGDKQKAYFPACIENVDNEIGRVLKKLDSMGISDNTIVIFTSDNGPASYAKNNRAYRRNDGTAKPYRGNKYGLWDGSMHVPCFMKWPSKVKPNTVIETPASGVDFFPTLCRLGKTKKFSHKIDGIDLIPVILGQGRDLKRNIPLQWHFYNSTLKDKSCPRAVLRDGNYVLTGFYDTDKPTGRGRWYPDHMDFLKNQKLTSFKLFNISKDKQQENDISSKHPELFKRLSGQLKKYHVELQGEAYGWEKEFSELNNKKGK